MYKPRTSFSGFKIGLNNDRAYIGVPDGQYDSAGFADIEYLGIQKTLRRNDAVTTLSFPDKYGRNTTYTLYYYEWGRKEKPIDQLSLEGV